MKRVLVIGCPGSGKSTFAKALHEKTGLPLCHLDMLYWNPDKTNVEDAVFLQRLLGVLERERWIVDGNYASSLELRMQSCDTIFFFCLHCLSFPPVWEVFSLFSGYKFIDLTFFVHNSVV